MKLTKTQLEQLLSYCESVMSEGWYYGNKAQFFVRHNAIVAWAEAALKEML